MATNMELENYIDYYLVNLCQEKEGDKNVNKEGLNFPQQCYFEKYHFSLYRTQQQDLSSSC